MFFSPGLAASGKGDDSFSRAAVAPKRNFAHVTRGGRVLVLLLGARAVVASRRDDRRGKFTNLEPFFSPSTRFERAAWLGDPRMISFPYGTSLLPCLFSPPAPFHSIRVSFYRYPRATRCCWKSWIHLDDDDARVPPSAVFSFCITTGVGSWYNYGIKCRCAERQTDGQTPVTHGVAGKQRSPVRSRSISPISFAAASGRKGKRRDRENTNTIGMSRKQCRPPDPRPLACPQRVLSPSLASITSFLGRRAASNVTNRQTPDETARLRNAVEERDGPTQGRTHGPTPPPTKSPSQGRSPHFSASYESGDPAESPLPLVCSLGPLLSSWLARLFLRVTLLSLYDYPLSLSFSPLFIV